MHGQDGKHNQAEMNRRIVGRAINNFWWDIPDKKPNDPVERFGVPLSGKLLH
jgi:hypothetical protein